MSKIKLKVKVSEEAYELAYFLANMYKCNIDEVIEMALTDFWLKHVGINVIPSESMSENEVRVIVLGKE